MTSLTPVAGVSTPLTDAQRLLKGATGTRKDGRRMTLAEAVDADFARDLEQRLAAAQAECAHLSKVNGELGMEAIELRRSLSDSVSLLREADQLWTTSWANQNRGVWDTDWNERRVAFLATFVAEKATTSEVPK